METNQPYPLSEVTGLKERRVLLVVDPVRYPEPMFTQVLEGQLLEHARKVKCKLQDLRAYILCDGDLPQVKDFHDQLRIPMFCSLLGLFIENSCDLTMRQSCELFSKIIVLMSADNSEAAEFVKKYLRSYEVEKNGPEIWAALIPPCRHSFR